MCTKPSEKAKNESMNSRNKVSPVVRVPSTFTQSTTAQQAIAAIKLNSIRSCTPSNTPLTMHRRPLVQLITTDSVAS